MPEFTRVQQGPQLPYEFKVRVIGQNWPTDWSRFTLVEFARIKDYANSKQATIEFLFR